MDHPPFGMKLFFERKKQLTIIKASYIQPDFEKQDGLVPVIVQEYNQNQGGKVLMLAYVNDEAYNLTLETGFAHFWSRSRKKLWKKGETSGNLLKVKEIWIDCDQDTLLYLVTSRGAVCHLGGSNCFFRVTDCDSKEPKKK